MSDPKISIIIPTINREECLSQTLLYLQKQIHVAFEVIVIYQSIIEHIKITDFPVNFSFIPSKVESASAARNIGIKNSKSEILLFIDDDVIIDDNYFAYNHYKHYTDIKIPGVVGRSLNKDNHESSYKRQNRSFHKIVGFFYFPKNYGCNTFVTSGRSNNLSVRKEIAIAVGGMDENYEKGAHREEGDFCLRVSRKYGEFLFDPQAKLVHVGNKKGGIRSWNDNDYIKAQHNMVGAIYFDLKMAPLRYKHEYFFATLRYFILNKTILSRPELYFPVIKRVISSFYKAFQLYHSGPKYLK